MKTFTLILLGLGCAFAQAVYIEPPPALTVSGNPPSGSFPTVLAASGARITICSYPSCASLTQTYTDATAVTPCPTTAQAVIAGTSTCTDRADTRGNFGFWVLTGGQYQYKITLRNGTVYGPYPVTMQTNNAANVQLIGPDGLPHTVQDVTAVGAAKGAELIPYNAQRTMQQKAGDLISVKDYGAKGDGVTDDSAAFQACVNAAQVTAYMGGTCLVPAPAVKYLLNSTITFPAGGAVNLQGVGMPMLYHPTAASRVAPDAFAFVVSSQYNKIQGIQLQAAHGIKFYTPDPGTASSNNTIRDNAIDGSTGPSRGTGYGTNDTVGIYFAGDDSTSAHPMYYNTIENNRLGHFNVCIDLGGPAWSYGFWAYGANANNFINNYYFDYWRAVFIHGGYGNSFWGGWADSASGNSGENSYIYYLTEHANMNNIYATVGEPGQFAASYYLDSTTVNNYVVESPWFNGIQGTNNSTANDASNYYGTGANVRQGGRALVGVTTGNNNTAIGYWSQLATTTGNANTSLGSNALQSNTTGSNNTVMGSGALISSTTGSNNVAAGQNAENGNTTGGNNVAVGSSALQSSHTMDGQTAVGSGSMLLATSGFDNVAVGNAAMLNLTGVQYSVAIGTSALRGGASPGYLSGDTAIGNRAMYSVTTGTLNTAIGNQALFALTTGALNTAIGNDAGYTDTPANANTTGGVNTWIGAGSGPDSPTQVSNTIAIGWNALVHDTNDVVIGNANNIRAYFGSLAATAQVFAAGYAAGGHNGLTTTVVIGGCTLTYTGGLLTGKAGC